jgi:Domain of unknown function (DUF5655)/Domain of unknown function (DUF4287)
MSSLDKALATQLANIEKRAGKTLAELVTLVKATGLAKHGEIRDHLKSKLGMGHGDANTLTHYALQTSSAFEAGPATDDPLATIYTEAKEHLRPIHEKLLAAIAKFGDFEIAPKKGYVSLRRKKQFATVGPATNSRVDVGLNMKGVPATDRLAEEPPKGMCQYKVRLTAVSEVDAELLAWVRMAFDSAG